MKSYLLILLTTASLSLAEAATDSTPLQLQELTLGEAIQRAEEQHPDLARQAALLEASEARLHHAGRLPNPEAIAKVETARLSGKTTGDADYFLGVSQTIPLGGRLGKARRVESAERTRRQAALEKKLMELRRDVRNAFATALFQERAYLAQREILTNTLRVARITQARLEQGDIPASQLARIDMVSAQARMELRRIGSLRDMAMTGLAGAMGNPALTIESLEGGLESTLELPTLESLSGQLAHHPSQKLAEAAWQAGDAKVDLAKAEIIPDIKVDILYRRIQSEDRNALDFGLSLPLPLYHGSKGHVHEARAERQAAQARARALENQLSSDLTLAHARLSLALQSSRALREDILPRAATILKTAEARFAAGDSSLRDLLPVRNDWAGLQLTYLETLRDVMQAWAELAPYLKR